MVRRSSGSGVLLSYPLSLQEPRDRNEIERMAFAGDMKLHLTWWARQSLAYPDRCRQQRYEVQSLRLGELTIVALEGEVCSEWGGMARAMAPTKHAMVVAYANHCPGYIPTARIIREGVQPACHAGRRRLAKPSEGSGRNAFFLGPNGPRFKKKASRKLCSPLFRRGGRCRRSLRRHFRASLGAHETKRVCARRAIPPAHVYAVQFARIAAVKSVNPIIDIER